MQHVNTILGIILGLVTLTVTATSVVAIARANFAKQQIIALRGDRDDLQHRVDILESENERQTAELINEKQKVAVLEKVVTGKEDLEEIIDQLTKLSVAVNMIKNKVGAHE